ncbi:hypothetical protein RvY_00238, partial [Ramazzottius varieornatus]
LILINQVTIRVHVQTLQGGQLHHAILHGQVCYFYPVVPFAIFSEMKNVELISEQGLKPAALPFPGFSQDKEDRVTDLRSVS